MKIISSLVLTLGLGALLISGTVSPVAPRSERPSPVAPKTEKYTAPVAPKVVESQPVQAPAVVTEAPKNNSAIKVIAPQKDLETAIRNSQQGDILLMGPEGWYRLDAKTLKQGTKVFVLGSQDAMTTSFPKEVKKTAPEGQR